MKKALIIGMWLGMALSAGAGIIVWDNTGGGVWSAKANWKPKQVPGAGDTAVITNSGNFTVTLDVAANVSGLVLGAGDGTTQTFAFNGQTLSLDGAATLNPGGQMDFSSGTFNGDTNTGGAVFNGTLTCSGGALAGKFTVASNSVLNLAATNALSSLVSLTNYGTVNWGNADLVGASGLQLFNQGLWQAQGNNTFLGNGAGFNNSGTFRKTAGAGTTLLDTNTTFNSSGMVDVQSGTLAVSVGNCSGTFNTTQGTILNCGSSSSMVTFTLNGSLTFTGNGIVTGPLISGNNALIGGTVTLSGVTLHGSMTVSNNGVVNFVGDFGQTHFWPITFYNYGTVNWSNTDLSISADFYVDIYNYGLWVAQANNTFYGTNSQNDHFYNRGTLRKSTSGGVTVFDKKITLQNQGTVEIQQGTLTIQNGYAIGDGVFSLATNAIADFPATAPYGFMTYGNTSFTGDGIVQGMLSASSGGTNFLTGGAITFSSVTFLGPLNVGSNAVMNIVGGANINDVILKNFGIVAWCSGDWHDSYPSQIYNYGLWDCRTNSYYYGASGTPTVINNYGVFRKSGGTFSGSPSVTWLDNNTVFNNYGTLDVQVGGFNFNQLYDSGLLSIAWGSGVDATACYLSGNPAFSGLGALQGTIVSSNAVVKGTLRFGFNTTLAGKMTFDSNAVVNLALPGPVEMGVNPIVFNGLVLTNYGTINWNNVDISAPFPSQIYNFGVWDCVTNRVFNGSSGTPTVFNNFGIFRKSSGLMAYDITYLNNNVAFNNFNNGTLDAQRGRIWLGGPFSLGQGVLNCGINSPTDFGTFYLSGTGSLSGVLSVNLNNGFSPTMSNSFALVYYPAQSGSFSSINLPAPASGCMWQSTYGDTAFTLSVVVVPSPTLTAPMLTGGNSVSFAWASVPGQVYQVQFATNLAPVNWFDLGSSITATNTTQSVTDVIGVDPQRFYRVVVP